MRFVVVAGQAFDVEVTEEEFFSFFSSCLKSSQKILRGVQTFFCL